MEQIIDLLLKMPPIVSAIVSMIACAILWFGGQRFLAPIMKELATQSRELKTQSKDLVEIKIQTTRTNGQVLSLEKTVATHEALDEDRHEDTTKRLDRNQNSTHNLRDQVSEFAMRVGVQARRINKRDDALGLSSKPPSASPNPEGDAR